MKFWAIGVTVSGGGISPGVLFRSWCLYYSDVMMSAMASQITGVSIVCLTVCWGAYQRKHQSSASLAFVRVDSPHQGPVMRKMYPFHDVIIIREFMIFEIWDFGREISMENHSPMFHPWSPVWRFICVINVTFMPRQKYFCRGIINNAQA